MSGPWSVAIAVVFVWLGMVLAISFIEAPLKFRAPGVTLRVGLGIGRLVFRALNICELLLAALLVGTFAFHWPPLRVEAAAGVAIGALLVQLLLVRPALTRRSDAVLAGSDAPRSRGHYVYIAFEAIKAMSLLVTGILLLGA
ncbi:hypothetical protein [Mycolicibacterium komossense]|uniref:Transmembrane protein n=1 Tax=Mycolicibacterium komossense TaxID=1779 RepID=A0ABT3CG71_9MYCO|nr:hypothetical protein [Mycolicibacterium komossense]MCV7228416.1 hypothetical protein [Mycolicibacterium komossense]